MIWWYILIAVVALALSFFLSLKAGEIASDKGYDGDQWTWLCFLLGLGAYILVAAMPDLEERKVLKDISAKLEQVTANNSNPVSEVPQTTRRSVPAVPAANYSAGWICKKCGTSNQDGKLFCKGCGTYKALDVSTTSDSEGWVCKNCGTKNARDAQFCKDCGEYK